MSISSIGSSVTSNVNSTQADSIKTLLSSVENQPTLLDMLSENGTGTGISSGDVLDLSAQAQAQSDQMYELLSSLELSSMQASVDKVGASVQQKLSQAFSENGIDTSQQIDLQVGSDGNVVVANDHPQKQQIEDTINNDPDLKKAVVQYLKFMQTIAPSLQNNNAPQTAFAGELGQLLSSLGSGNSPQGTATLCLQGNAFETSYQSANDNAQVPPSPPTQ